MRANANRKYDVDRYEYAPEDPTRIYCVVTYKQKMEVLKNYKGMIYDFVREAIKEKLERDYGQHAECFNNRDKSAK